MTYLVSNREQEFINGIQFYIGFGLINLHLLQTNLSKDSQIIIPNIQLRNLINAIKCISTVLLTI